MRTFKQLAADLDLGPVVVARRHPRERDGTPDGRRETAARDFALTHAIDDDFLVIAKHAFIFK